MKKKKFPERCKKCSYKEFTITLGSPDIPVWHCRYGFYPGKYCLYLAHYNDAIIIDKLKKSNSFDSSAGHSCIQLTFDFDL